MLPITFTIFMGLFTVSIALVGSFRVTINGIIPIQRADYNTFILQIKTKFASFYSDFETELKTNFHCIANEWDRASYLSSILTTIVSVIIVNIVYLLTFYFVCSTLVDVYKISLDNIYSNLKYISFIGYAIWCLVICYGFYSILQVDRYEEIIKMSRYREFVKLKTKL